MVAGADVTAGVIAKQISMAVTGPPALAPDAAAGLDAGIGAGAAEAIACCVTAGGAGVAGSEDGGWPRTKFNVVPGGKTTRWPVATAETLEGTFFGLPKPPRTDPTALAAPAAALCAALVTLAELLVTAMAWPLITTEESCATQPDPFRASVRVAGAPWAIVTPLPALTGLVTEVRYCLPAGSLAESTASIILTTTVMPATGGF
jgi:hypothetical protein